MKSNLKSICPQNSDYVSISSQLRTMLELELEKLFDQQVFSKYKDQKLLNVTQLKKDHQLHNYIFDSKCMNFTLKGKLLSGINNWFRMHTGDRQFIILKFRELYYKSMPVVDLLPVNIFNIIFCKFLINELLKVLAESGWQLKLDDRSLN